ncbi:MAG: hypothetical protein SNF33_01550 [Candidatus Algichlamydia australiensis]|nr:hypothetical protein [Chlamydiales bacterium]
MTILKHSLNLSLLCTLLSASPTATFVPPKGWRAQDPTAFNQAKISFISKKTQGFNPSINLAIEPTSLRLEEYTKNAIKCHKMDKRNRCERMGQLKTLSGEGVLLKIERTLEWGKVELMQLLQIANGHAYILTASAKKSDFQNVRSEVTKSFRSLELVEDFLKSAGRKSYNLKMEIAKEKKKIRLPTIVSLPIIVPRLKNLQKFCEKELPEKGSYWHALFIKQIAQEIFNEKKNH